MEAGFFEALRVWGPGVGLVVGIFILAWVMMRHIIKQSNLVLENYKEERMVWNKTIDNHMDSNTKVLDRLCSQIDRQAQSEKHSRDFVRREHEQILKANENILQALIKLNGGRKGG